MLEHLESPKKSREVEALVNKTPSQMTLAENEQVPDTASDVFATVHPNKHRGHDPRASFIEWETRLQTFQIGTLQDSGELAVGGVRMGVRTSSDHTSICLRPRALDGGW